MHALWVPVIRSHFALIDEERWSGLDSQRLGARLIELNARSDLFTFHVSFKLMEIESERFRIGNKQCSRVAGATPNRLFPVQRVVHLPVAALETGRFGGQGGVARELMHRERKIAKD